MLTEIQTGEFVDPESLINEYDILVSDSAPAIRMLDREQILKRLHRSEVPEWLHGQTMTAISQVRSALEKIGFDVMTRLDDYTLIAANTAGPGTKPVVVLELRQKGFDLSEMSITQFEKAVADAPILGTSTPLIAAGEFLFKGTAVAIDDLPEWCTRFTPGLILRETLRLTSLLDHFERGGLLDGLTLMPGETRLYRETKTSSSKTTHTRKLTNTDTYSETNTESLKRSLNSTWEQSRNSSKSKDSEWKSGDTFNNGLRTFSSSSRDTQKESRSLSDISKTVRETITNMSSTSSAKLERIQLSEQTFTSSSSTELEHKLELKNASKDAALTFAIHRVIGVYYCHLDLLDIALYYQGADLDDEPIHIPLNGNTEVALEDATGDAAQAATLHTSLVSLLKSRYEPLGVLRIGATNTIDVTPPMDDDPNNELTIREVMTSIDKRRKNGALPVCLSSTKTALATGLTCVQTFGDRPTEDDAATEKTNPA